MDQLLCRKVFYRCWNWKQWALQIRWKLFLLLVSKTNGLYKYLRLLFVLIRVNIVFIIVFLLFQLEITLLWILFTFSFSQGFAVYTTLRTAWRWLGGESCVESTWTICNACTRLLGCQKVYICKIPILRMKPALCITNCTFLNWSTNPYLEFNLPCWNKKVLCLFFNLNPLLRLAAAEVETSSTCKRTKCLRNS